MLGQLLVLSLGAGVLVLGTVLGCAGSVAGPDLGAGVFVLGPFLGCAGSVAGPVWVLGY